MTTAVDQWELAALAKDLLDLYTELNARKHDKAQAPRGERVMKPSPGPITPGASWAISLDVEMTDQLFEMTRDAINYTSRRTVVLSRHSARLCAIIRTNAMEIVENFPAANDLADLMRDQVAELKRKLQPKQQATRAPEKYVDVETITRNLKARGHTVTNRQARDVATYNQFDVGKFTDGRNGYKLSQFLIHYEAKHHPDLLPPA